MIKPDPTVKNETKYIALWVLIFSIITQAIFLVIKKWDYTVLLGNILSGTAAILNFFIMGLTVQSAVLKEEKEAKNLIKVSQTLRMFGLLAVAVIGAAIPSVFNLYTVLIPLIFPRLAIALRPLFFKDNDTK